MIFPFGGKGGEILPFPGDHGVRLVEVGKNRGFDRARHSRLAVPDADARKPADHWRNSCAADGYSSSVSCPGTITAVPAGPSAVSTDMIVQRPSISRLVSK